jgi:argininosuccinate synthase
LVNVIPNVYELPDTDKRYNARLWLFTKDQLFMNKSGVNKVVLAYSGGLDTSIILKWLQDEYGCEVVTFTADIGQGEEVEPARAKAQAMGIKEIYIDDLREEFARDFVFPMFRANAVYEGEYLLGTSIARPLISKRLIEIANETQADAISHGATGKGNDQVRFELGAYALKPDVRVIAPWREWDLLSREKLMKYAEDHGIEIDYAKQGKKSPYSMDANLLHISYEGGILEDPWAEPEEDMWRWTVSPEAAPDEPTYLELSYEKGDIVAIDGAAMSPATIMEHLNILAGENGVGRDDIVENRYVGMKSRGCYETPAGTVMLKGHRAIESLTLDREAAHLKDELMPKYAKLVYNGYWWSPEREAMQALIDKTQETVNGDVRLKLYKGGVSVVGRRSASNSLFDESIATFEDDGGAYNQADAEGFIKLNALRLRVGARNR